ncbi:MAG: lysophospholipid acyltransferase family protein [Candidatus Sericytochromatia bacterium]|nr:lysophospholipid acyltransferase family protein [Candidatus Tanganyikabacteria bacterium]
MGRREPLWQIWGRRAVSVPSFLVLLLVALAALPVAVAASVAADVAVPRRGRLARTRALVFLVIFLLCENAGVLAAWALWVVFLGGALSGRDRWLAANAALQRCWCALLLGAGRRVFGLGLEVENPGALGSAPFILLARHTSTADTVLAAALMTGSRNLLLGYVLKRELLWDPCIDIVGRRLPNVFVGRGAGTRGADLEAIGRLAASLGQSGAVLIYPEGTRFSEAKREAAVARLDTAGRPDLASLAREFRHVLPPRPAGALALLDGSPGADVVILEHVGFEGAATLADFWNGALIGRRLLVRFRRIARASIPSVDRERWLFEVWRDTDRWVGEALATQDRPGRAPSEPAA